MYARLQKKNLQAFESLLKCLDNERPVALVGAGLVIRAGYPSWDGLIEQLHEKSGIARRLGEARADFVRRHEDALFRAALYRKELLRRDRREKR